MDLGYNNHIKRSDISFPKGFIFSNNKKEIYLKTSIDQEITVTPSGIKIISPLKTIFVGKNHISHFSIDSDLISPSHTFHFSFIGRNHIPHFSIHHNVNRNMISYKIIVHLKRELAKTTQLELLKLERSNLDLSYNNEIISKQTAFFLIQEFSKMLDFPLSNSSKNNDIFHAPNFYNFDVVKNDHQNLIIKRESLYSWVDWLAISISSFIGFSISIFFVYLVFDCIRSELLRYSYSGIFDTCFILNIGSFMMFSFAIFELYQYHKKQGLYISIDACSISISKLNFFKAKPRKPRNIELTDNITIGINERKPFFPTKEENKNFEVVLEQGNERNSKTKNIVLINKITQPEAEYLVNKICYLSDPNHGKNFDFSNNIQTIEPTIINKIVTFIVFAICYIVIIHYFMLAIAKLSLYTRIFC